MKNTVLLTASIVIATASPAFSQELPTKVLTHDLQNPCGIAIRPGSGEIFVSDTGRGRVVQVEGNAIKEIVTEFPVEAFELDSELILGPLGLLFRGRDTLVVGNGGMRDGADSISVFDIATMGQDPFNGRKPEMNFTLEPDGEAAAEGDFFAMARTRTGLFVSCNGDRKKGWIAKADLVVGNIKNFRRFIPAGELSKTPNPGGIAISPQGHIVVAQMGKRDEPGDSVIAFYNEAGELLDKFPTGLNDIVALAYGPRKKRLYALDFSWADPAKGGLYKIVAVDTADGCRAELVANLERPTAMAFDRSGTLYVTVCGIKSKSAIDVDEESGAPGKVIMINDVD